MVLGAGGGPLPVVRSISIPGAAAVEPVGEGWGCSRAHSAHELFRGACRVLGRGSSVCLHGDWE